VKTRKLGELEVSELGLGCMSISASYGPPADIDEVARTLDQGNPDIGELMPTIYISDNGDDKNDGLSLQTPIYSLNRAKSTLRR